MVVQQVNPMPLVRWVDTGLLQQDKVMGKVDKDIPPQVPDITSALGRVGMDTDNKVTEDS